MKEVDARGYPCPQPVLLTKKVVDEGEAEIVVLVDNRGSADNVARFGEKAGYEVNIEELSGDFKVILRKSSGVSSSPESPEAAEITCETGSWKLLKGKALLISTDSIGRGSDELGRILVKALLNTLSDNEKLPEKIVLINSGVKLACEGSDVLEALQTIVNKGVEILACGTCLNYFQLTEQLKVGRVSNAYEILNVLLENQILPWG